MSNHISITIDELDKLDNYYANENNRRYANLLSYIGSNEEIYFCYYAIVSDIKFLFQRYKDLEICILTGTKLIHAYNLSGRIEEIPINQILDLSPDGGAIFVKYSRNSYRIQNETSIQRESSCLYIFCSNEDKELQTNILREIRQAIAIQKNPSILGIRNTVSAQLTVQSSITSQLERLADLHKSGALTDEEFTNAKEKIL